MTATSKFESLRITNQRVADLLVGAMEGGSNHWIEYVEYLGETGETAEAICSRLSIEPRMPRYAWAPLAGGSWAAKIVQVEGAPDVRLDRDAIVRGLAVMAKRYPMHFADVLNENEDATTADVFLQCCAFGDVIYG
jgi:hypothetical protein